MFDFDAGKIIIVGVIALIFIPPKDLPRVLRQAGQFVGKMRRMASEFQGQFMDAMREADMADLRREAQKLSDAARSSSGLDSIHHLDADMNRALHRSGTSEVQMSGTAPAAAIPSERSEREPAGTAPESHADLAAAARETA